MNQLIEKIKENNGTAMLIGGAVIDAIQNREIKDWDIEVYGLNYEKLIKILEELKLPINLVGKSFGVIKTKINDIDIDLSIPRIENKCGILHTNFYITLDSNLTPEEAGRRRDITINSMYQNLHTGEIIDPFNGVKDLENGIIRATDKTTFVDDPLRVLRIMQLLPRKAKMVSPETMDLCVSLSNEFSDERKTEILYEYGIFAQYEFNIIPKERVFEEFNKLLLKAKKPSLGLNFLKDSNWLKHFPELYNLIGCKQNPDWHPEGDVWIHTLMAIDNAAEARENINEEHRLAFMYAALLHDIGKPSMTLEDLTSNGHDQAGVALAENFMKRLTNDVELIKTIKELVGLHMRAGQLTSAEANISAWKRLHNKMRLDILGWLSKSDSNARTGRDMFMEHKPSELCFTYFKEFGTEKIKSIVTGKDLIALGWKPGKELGDLLKKCYEMQIDGCVDKDELISKMYSDINIIT